MMFSANYKRPWLQAVIFLCLCFSFHTVSLAEHTVKSDHHYDAPFSLALEYAPDTVAWLYQPDNIFNQPIPYHSDPYYYFKRQFEGRFDANGSVYLTGEKTPDFSESVLTLYGKNNLDYSLFGVLSEYQDPDYYESHPTFYLLTPDAQYQLDVFAGIRTTHADEESWVVTPWQLTHAFDQTLNDILESSFISTIPSTLPKEGDDWMLFSTTSENKQGNRYVLYARKRRMTYDEGTPITYVNQIDMDERETQNGIVSADGVGSWISYAQNDPTWEKLVFEVETSRRWRPFGDGGCGPTSIAIAIANLVDKEELLQLAPYASSPHGYVFCTCSINDYWCNKTHIPYRPTTPEEYLRYFPLLIGNFATGNNTFEVIGRSTYGTNMEYLDEICSIFDITYEQTSELSEAIAFLKKEGTIAIACTLGQPFTNNSHFLVLCGVDDEYLYLLDPLRREEYLKTDPKELIEIVTPGLIRLTYQNAESCHISPIYLMERKDCSPD